MFKNKKNKNNPNWRNLASELNAIHCVSYARWGGLLCNHFLDPIKRYVIKIGSRLLFLHSMQNNSTHRAGKIQ